MTARAGLPLALLAALGCASSSSSARGLLRVDLPGPDAGPGSEEELLLVQAVRDAADVEGLSCHPATAGGAVRCSPVALSSQSHALTLSLQRSGTGYSIAIEQGFHLGGSTAVCDFQRRVLAQIANDLSPQVVHVDTRSDCKDGKP